MNAVLRRQRKRRRQPHRAAPGKPWRMSYSEFLDAVENPWARRSFEFVNSSDYLDQIEQVYPVQENEVRELDPELWGMIDRAYDRRDDAALVMALLRAPRFPYNDPYVGQLRKFGEAAVSRNPKQVLRIARRIYDMSKQEVHAACREPVEASRQMGPAFRNWIHDQYPLKDEEGFLAHDDGVCQLAGGDKALEEFARRHLGYREPRGKGNKKMGIDAILKINGLYVPIEAKFFSEDGGTQRHQLQDVLDFTGRFPKDREDVEPIGVIDGHYLGFHGDYVSDPDRTTTIKRPQQQIAECRAPLLSALLLERLVEELECAPASAAAA